MSDIDKILKDYSKRMKSMSNYYYLISFFINRNKFKEFTNEEFFNVSIQILCLLFERSIKRATCFKEDIVDFLNILNIKIYKKELDDKYLDELASYFISMFNNNGKTYYFPIHGVDGVEDINVNLVMDTVVSKGGQDKLSYSLTEEGYKFLLKTKEYDELMTIRINQIVAKIRLSSEDFLGAKSEIDDIVNSIEIQKQKIENYMKAIKSDITYINDNDFTILIENSLEVLREEMIKYDSLSKEVKTLIVDKEAILESSNDKSFDKLIKQLDELKDLIDSIRRAQSAATSLIKKILSFDREYKEILNVLLRTTHGSRYSFKDVVLNVVESDFSKIDKLMTLYKPLFGVRNIGLFNINHVYQEQVILRDKNNLEGLYEKSVTLDTTNKAEEEKKIAYNEDYYFNLVDKIVEFSLDKEKFTLKDFINFYIKNNQNDYMELTASSSLFRNALIEIVVMGVLDICKIKEELSRIEYSQSLEFSVHRVFQRIFKKRGFNLVSYIRSIKVSHMDEIIKINTEIKLEDMTTVVVEVPNLLFEVD